MILSTFIITLFVFIPMCMLKLPILGKDHVFYNCWVFKDKFMFLKLSLPKTNIIFRQPVSNGNLQYYHYTFINMIRPDAYIF